MYGTMKEPLFHSPSALYRFHHKLKLLKSRLKALNWGMVGDIPAKTKTNIGGFLLKTRGIANPGVHTYKAMLVALEK